MHWFDYAKLNIDESSERHMGYRRSSRFTASLYLRSLLFGGTFQCHFQWPFSSFLTNPNRLEVSKSISSVSNYCSMWKRNKENFRQIKISYALLTLEVNLRLLRKFAVSLFFGSTWHGLRFILEELDWKSHKGQKKITIFETYRSLYLYNVCMD